jgi:hypothetical protein
MAGPGEAPWRTAAAAVPPVRMRDGPGGPNGHPHGEFPTRPRTGTVGRVRSNPLLTAVSAVLAAVALSAAAGCTTVSAPLPAAHVAPTPSAGRTASPTTPARPDGAGVPPAVHQVVDTVGATPAATPRVTRAAGSPSGARHHRRAPHQVPERDAAPVPSALSGLPRGAGVCDLARSYGGWGAGTEAGQACHQAVGPLDVAGVPAPARR